MATLELLHHSRATLLACVYRLRQAHVPEPHDSVTRIKVRVVLGCACGRSVMHGRHRVRNLRSAKATYCWGLAQGYRNFCLGVARFGELGGVVGGQGVMACRWRSAAIMLGGPAFHLPDITAATSSSTAPSGARPRQMCSLLPDGQIS